ncbi:hypothetical protein G6F66_014477 [Rhizopus arrhizus]|nr:hypothetical protein G6F66_014477 [Rhizopus arrhizus]
MPVALFKIADREQRRRQLLLAELVQEVALVLGAVGATEQQPLAAALDAYSRLTGVDLVIGAALPTGHPAPALRGDFDDAQALSRLLAGTGLRPRFIDARRATLEPAPAERSDGSRRTGPLRVQGDTAHGQAPGTGASQQ